MFAGEMLLPSENTEKGLEEIGNLCPDGNTHANFKLAYSSLQSNSRQFTTGQNQCISAWNYLKADVQLVYAKA